MGTKNSKQKKNAAIATSVGATAAAGASKVVGGMGLAVGGTGFSVGLLPVTVAGGIVDLAAYGLYRAVKK